MSSINNNLQSEIGSSTFYGTTSNTSATTKGTKIVKPGSDMDKNAFLRILTAELTNQDPMNTKDSTQYVAQMAQFTSMEQMSNLNATMSRYAANSLIGKGVILNINDVNGNPYSGVVKDVTNNSGQISLGVLVSNNGTSEIMDFDSSNVQYVYDVPNNNLDSLTGNASILTAAAFIGKKAELDVKDSNGNNITGLVKGMIRDNTGIKLKVQPDDGGDSILVSLDQVTNLDMI